MVAFEGMQGLVQRRAKGGPSSERGDAGRRGVGVGRLTVSVIRPIGGGARPRLSTARLCVGEPGFNRETGEIRQPKGPKDLGQSDRARWTEEYRSGAR